MKKLAIVLIFGAFLALGAQAYADPVTFTISSINVTDTNFYNFTYNYLYPSFTLDTRSFNVSNPLTWYSDRWTGNLFRINTTSDFDSRGDRSGVISITMQFSVPAGMTNQTDAGILIADARWGRRTDQPDHVIISWGNPFTASFGNGGLVRIDMRDIDVTIGNNGGSAWVGGTFTLLNEGTPIHAMPEPGSLLLLGAGITGLGLVASRRRKR
jgi:hypothetical protein